MSGGCSSTQGSTPGTGVANALATERGLVAHWCFDDGFQIATDCSKGGFHGTVHGKVNRVDGIVGGAGQFDGRSWIEVPSPFFLDGLCEASVSAYIRTDNIDTWGQIIGSGDSRGGSDPLSFQFTGGRFGNMGFGNTLEGTDIKANGRDSTVRLQQDRWVHFATTLTRIDGGARLRLFLDGVMIDEVERSGPHCIGYDIPMPTQIGAIHGSQAWVGTIDELRIYNRPLLPEEVALLAAPLVAASTTSAR